MNELFQSQINVVGVGVFATTYFVTQSLRDAAIVGIVHGTLHYLVGKAQENPKLTPIQPPSTTGGYNLRSY